MLVIIIICVKSLFFLIRHFSVYASICTATFVTKHHVGKLLLYYFIMFFILIIWKLGNIAPKQMHAHTHCGCLCLFFCIGPLPQYYVSFHELFSIARKESIPHVSLCQPDSCVVEKIIRSSKAKAHHGISTNINSEIIFFYRFLQYLRKVTEYSVCGMKLSFLADRCHYWIVFRMFYVLYLQEVAQL